MTLKGPNGQMLLVNRLHDKAVACGIMTQSKEELAELGLLGTVCTIVALYRAPLRQSMILDHPFGFIHQSDHHHHTHAQLLSTTICLSLGSPKRRSTQCSANGKQSLINLFHKRVLLLLLVVVVPPPPDCVVLLRCDCAVCCSGILFGRGSAATPSTRWATVRCARPHAGTS